MVVRKRPAVAGGRRRSLRVVMSDDEYATVRDASESAELATTGTSPKSGLLGVATWTAGASPRRHGRWIPLDA